MNEIHIRGLKLETRIGVPEEERAQAQTVEVDVDMSVAEDFQRMGDEVERTVDYHAVALAILELGLERPRKLIETLAADIATRVLDGFAVVRVRVRIRKFILPQTEWVGVTYERSRRD